MKKPKIPRFFRDVPPDVPRLKPPFDIHIPEALRRNRKDGRGRNAILFPELCVTKAAAKIGISQAHLSYILLGKRVGSVNTLRAISKVLGVPVDHLMKLAEWQQRQRQQAS